MRCTICCLVILTAAVATGAPLTSRGGSITLKVPRYEDAVSSLVKLVADHHGEIADRKTDVTDKGRKHGWLRVQVPRSELDGLLSDVRTTGQLYGESISVTDHTGESAELAKRITRLQEHQSRLSGILNSTRKLRGSDILYVQERLFRAGVDEDLLALQREGLGQDADRSSIVVTFFEPLALAEPPKTAWEHVTFAVSQGFRDLAKAGLGAIGGILRLLAWLVILVPVALILRRQYRKHEEKIRKFLMPEPPSPPSE